MDDSDKAKKAKPTQISTSFPIFALVHSLSLSLSFCFRFSFCSMSKPTRNGEIVPKYIGISPYVYAYVINLLLLLFAEVYAYVIF